MQAFPHHYSVTAHAETEGVVALRSGALELDSAPPVQFGGDGQHWSPEDLLTAAVADCFVLSFKAVARASALAWLTLDCDVKATLDRVEKVTRFTDFYLQVRLRIPANGNREMAEKLLHKADNVCLISSSLNGSVHLDTEIIVDS